MASDSSQVMSPWHTDKQISVCITIVYLKTFAPFLSNDNAFAILAFGGTLSVKHFELVCTDVPSIAELILPSFLNLTWFAIENALLANFPPI